MSLLASTIKGGGGVRATVPTPWPSDGTTEERIGCSGTAIGLGRSSVLDASSKIRMRRRGELLKPSGWDVHSFVPQLFAVTVRDDLRQYRSRGR